MVLSGDTGIVWDGVPKTNHHYIGKVHFAIFVMVGECPLLLSSLYIIPQWVFRKFFIYSNFLFFFIEILD
jgi:hypothetical protein